MSDISDYQVDHLLLLVGSNPVPNVVAGRLLTTPKDTITLIHSSDESLERKPDELERRPDGLGLAERLKSWFVRGGYSVANIGLEEIKESDADSVYKCVCNVLEQYKNKALKAYKSGSDTANKVGTIRIGLNYTGGTKVMAVHTYLALKNWVENQDREAIFSRQLVFSYLDARTLQIRFERVGMYSPISFSVSREVSISIRDLLKLHNWEPVENPVTEPVLPESARALLTIHSSAENARKWTGWLQNELFRNARTANAIEPPFWVFQSGKELPGQYVVKQAGPGTDWRKSNQLQNKEISWPADPDLQILKDSMSNELEQHKATHLHLTAATRRGCKSEKEFCRWLSGTWLESAVLLALQNCAQELELKDCCMDIKPREQGTSGDEQFQFDVAAIRGYQLFAFSCTTEGKRKDLLKQKLFEAWVRAQQLGGDEACTALVCCAEPQMVEKLEVEMRRDIALKGRIRVFGREHLTTDPDDPDHLVNPEDSDHLANLTKHIKAWIIEQSGDRK